MSVRVVYEKTDTQRFVKEFLELQDAAVLVAAGGDGSINEVRQSAEHCLAMQVVQQAVDCISCTSYHLCLLGCRALCSDYGALVPSTHSTGSIGLRTEYRLAVGG